jgi:hypothetical protein
MGKKVNPTAVGNQRQRNRSCSSCALVLERAASRSDEQQYRRCIGYPGGVGQGAQKRLFSRLPSPPFGSPP